MKHKLIVIGGGAAGIISAITAKDLDIDVAILEGTDRIGKKILTTGNGRCNISNKNIDDSRYHSDVPFFYSNTLKAFNLADTVNFFNSLGLPLINLDEDKMYPMSLQASSVIDIFRNAINDRSIPVYTNNKVSNIEKINGGFRIHANGDCIYECEKIILATGGKSATKTGSDGSGYTLAKCLGHTITTLVPAIVQLKLNYNRLKALSGVKFDGYGEIYVNGNLERKEFGEILFTDYGISGPPILQLSRIASYNLSKNKKVTLKIDMMPNMNASTLQDFLENHWGMFSYRSVHDSFIGIINKKLVPILLKEAGIDDIHKACWSLDFNEKLTLLSLLKNWEFEVSGTNSFENAQVTAGGIKANEVDSETLESKLIKGLYFAGEILDVDGDCGGFNLQWAWSSGAVAAKQAAL